MFWRDCIENAYSVAETHDKGFIAAGDTSSNDGVFKIIMEALMTDAINDSKIKANQLKIFPNPTNGVITIANNQLTKENYQLAIYDIFGSIVLQLFIQRAKFQIVTDVSSFSN